MTSFDRRSLLASLTGTAVVAGCRSVVGSNLSEESAPPVMPVIRRRWESGVEADYKTKYIKAVTLLKANNKGFNENKEPKEFLSWEGVLFVHEQSCQHGNWFLLPYHRLYLLYFEAACQRILQDPTFAVPYWDWTLNPEVPSEFYDEPILQEKRDLVKGAKLSQESVGAPVIDALMNSESFDNMHSFPPHNAIFSGVEQTGGFESKPHNGVHNGVGGFMGNSTKSPTDPVFWLHHCNIDRLWGIWLGRHFDVVAPYLTVTARSKAELPPGVLPWGESVIALDLYFQNPSGLPDMPQFAGIIDRSKYHTPPDIAASALNRVGPTKMLIRDILPADKLPYFYDTDASGAGPTLSTIKLNQSASANSKPRIESSIKGLATQKPSKISSKITFDEGTAEKLLQRLRKPKENEIAFVLTNVSFPNDPRSTVIRFFVLPDSSGQVPDFYNEDPTKLSSYVGACFLFPMTGHNHLGHKDTSRTSASNDITNWLSAYLEKSKTPLKDLTLVAVAVNIKNGYQPAAIFAADDKAELSLKLSLSEAL